MNCSPSVEKNKEILKDLWSIDKEKYKNFDNVVKFILDAPLSQENKIVSINVMAQIFVGLSTINPSINPGNNNNALQIAKSQAMISYENGFNKYLSYVKTKVGYKNNDVTNFEQLIDQIDTLDASGFENYTETDYKQYLLKPIANYFNNNKFVTAEAKQSYLDQVKEKLDSIVKKSKTPFTLTQLFDNFFEEMNVVTPYINLIEKVKGFEEEGDEKLDTYLITLDTHETVEAVKNTDGSYYDIHSRLIIPKNRYSDTDIKKALYNREAEGSDDKVSFVFYPNDFASGLRYKPYSIYDTNKDIVKAFESVLNPDSEIRIYAVKLNEYTDERIKEQKKIKGLENKNYETIESETQAEYLKSDPNAKVITYLRETKNSDQFTLMAEITNSDNSVNKFYIYGPTNFGLLNADNTVLKLDLTNDDHLKILQDYSVVKENKKSLDLDNFKIQKLKQLAIKFKNFKDSIAEEVEATPAYAIDVTDAFHKHYKIEKNFVLKTVETLEEAKISSPNVFFEVTTVSYDADGNRGEIEKKNIPFTFVKRKNNDISYLPVNYLNKNEFIVHEGKEYNIKDYFDAIGITEDFVIDDVLKGNNYNAVFLTMNQNGEYGYRTGKYAEAIYNKVLYTKFLSDIVQVLADPNAQAIFNNRFNQDKYSFRIKDSKKFGPVLNVDLDLGYEKDLQIQFTPYSRNKARYESLIQGRKSFFKFPLGKDTMTNLLDKIVPSLMDYNTLQARYPFLKDINLYDNKGQVNYSNMPIFINALYTNNIVGKDDIINKIIANTSESLEDFNKVIEDKVIKFIKEEEGYEQFLTFINEDFGSIENILFNTYENGMKIPFINFGVKSRESVEDTLDANFNNYFLVNNSKNNIIINTRDNSGVPKVIAKSEINKPVNNAPVIKEKTATSEIKNDVKEVKDFTKSSTEDSQTTIAFPEMDFTTPEHLNDEDVPFAVANDDRDFATLHDLNVEDAWFASTYSDQFSIEDLSNLSDFIKLTKLEGSVLGAVKDRVIYLNKVLRNNQKGVLYHEAFHGVFRYLMDDTKRRNLLDNILENKKYKSRFTEAAIQKFSEDRNLILDNSKLKDLIAEEILAEGFQNYMNKKMAPKTILDKFFEFLKNILDFFIKNSDHIDYAYDAIRKGNMKSEVVNSEIYNNEVAFLSIPGLIKSEIDTQTEKIVQKYTVLSSKEQNQLVDSVVKMIHDNLALDSTTASKSFDDMFEAATADLLNNTWNLEKLLNSVVSPYKDLEQSKIDIENKRKKIIELYGDKYKNYQFMLGGRMRGVNVTELNGTGSTQYDNKFYKHVYKSGKTEEPKDNSKGEVSYSLLKELVKQKYDAFNSLLNDNDDFDEEEKKELRSAQKNNYDTKIDNPLNENFDEQDETETESYDSKSIAEYGHDMQSLPKEVRQILSIISYKKFNEELGVELVRFVDGFEKYGVLLQISSNLDHDRVLENIKRVGEKLIDDNIYKDDGEDLIKIYEYIKEKCGIIDSENGEINTKNSQFYNIFVDTIVKSAVDYIVIDAQTKVTETEDDEGNVSYSSELVKYTLRDKILAEDINRKKNNIVSNFVSTYNERGNTQDYKKALRELNKICKTISTEKNFLSNVIDCTLDLEKMSKELSKNFQTIGLNLPTSLIRISLLAIQRLEYNNTPKIQEDSIGNQDYIDNQDIILSGNYLEKDFFTDMIDLLTGLYNQRKFTTTLEDTGGLMTGSDFADIMNDTEGPANRINIILRKSATYLVKYDPTSLPSVFRNAEGKPCYRYISTTPILTIADEIKKYGIVESLKDDVFFENSKDYYENNPYLKDLFLGNDTEMARKMKLFFKNFTATLYGGVNQKINDNIKDGKVFKDLDEQSQLILNLFSFMSRKVHSAKINNQKTEIEVFTRMFSTIESTNTNYLIPGIYEQYANKEGILLNEDGTYKATNKLMEKVLQEYSRMTSEALTRDKLIKEFNSNKKTERGKRLLNNYNAVLDSNNNKKVDESIKGLRAFKFNYLKDFFINNSDLEQDFVSYAIAGTDFNSIPQEKIQELKQSLNEYLKKGIEDYEKRLVKLNIINEKSISPGAYESKLLPKFISNDRGENTQITDIYSNVITDYKNLIADAYLNFFINGLFFNEAFDGDIALGIKNTADYFKRQKKNAATGSTLKKGYHKVAILDTIMVYQHPLYLEYGPYHDIKEIDKDIRLKNQPEIKDILKKDYGKKIIINNVEVDSMHKIFDGQSVSTLNHHIDMYDKIGRLNPKVEELLIKKQYMQLTGSELKYLKKNKVVLNSKKTVTGSRTMYHKLSEVYIDRLDISRIVVPEGKTLKDIQKILHGLYSQVYNLRLENHKFLQNNDFSKTTETEEKIRNIFEKQIHPYYEALPHREKLHTMLNSMEYHNIDQLMDTESSKTATVLPTSVDHKSTKGYMQLHRSSVFVPNRFKFWQVETSGIKTSIKYSVQSKALIPANLLDVPHIMSFKAQEELSEEEINNVMDEMSDLLANYHTTLKDVAESHEALMKKTFTNAKGQELNVGLMFDLIRKSLKEQEGVSDNKLKLFETNPVTGEPIHNANLPEIKKMLVFYFFSQYSKFTDEKGTGSKYIHMSSYGYNVIVDADGNTVFTDDYKNDPDKYKDEKGNVRHRPLGISIEEKDGKKIYWVECILPKSIQHDEAMIAKYKDKVLKMFATRIPTEDKRSMVALKVVDYMDAANMTGIIVPQLVHILAGSDLDIDTLYTQQYSFYRNAKGNKVLYGDYSSYASEEIGKFVEYVTYMGKDKDLSIIIKSKINSIKNGKVILENDAVKKVLSYSGIVPHKNFNFQSAFDTYKNNLIDKIDIDDVLSELDEIENSEEFQNFNDNEDSLVYRSSSTNQGYTIGDLINYKQEIEQQEESINNDIADDRVITKYRYDELLAIKKDYFKKLNELKYITNYIKLYATLETLADFKLPTSLYSFNSDKTNELFVKDKFQNIHLDAKLNILSNENVFKNLYIGERSSVQMFYDILSVFGIDLKAENNSTNPFTITGVVNSRVKNTLAKLGIGITANMNKTLAFLSQYFDENLNGNLKESVWKYRSSANEDVKVYNKLAGFTEDNIRTIAIIGNILGMFADGAKDPIPAVLNLNLINTPITLSMLSLGINSKFALALNFMPEIIRAISNVERTQAGIKDGITNERTYFVKELKEAMKDLNNLNGKNSALQELKDAGLVHEKSSVYDMKIINDNLVINYAPSKFDSERLKNEELSLKDLGITVTSLKNIKALNLITNEMENVKEEVELSEEAQKIVLLTLYKNQSEQTSKITAAGAIVNTFKKLNPNFTSFDKLKKNIDELKTGKSIITDDVVKRIFDENQVWSVINRIIQDIDKNSKIFLERSDIFKPIKDSFEYLFKDKNLFGNTVSSYVALYAYKNFYLKNVLTDPKFNNLSESTKLNKVIEKAMIDDMFTADYWFTNNLDEELSEMQRKYPDNELLKRLQVFKTKNVAINNEGEEFTEKFLRLVSASSITGSLQKDVENDANDLYVKEPLFFRKLFIHELVRTGLKTRQDSFIEYLNPDFKLPLSKYMDDFTSTLQKMFSDDQNKTKHLMEFLKTDDITDAYDFMKEMLVNLVYAASEENDNYKIRPSEEVNVSLDNEFSVVKKIDFSQLEDPEHDVVKELFSHIFPIPDSYQINDFNKKLKITGSNVFGDPIDNIVINMNIPDKSYGNISEYNMIDIAQKFNISFDEKSKTFKFPSVILIKSQDPKEPDNYFLLQGVDKNIMNNVGQNLIESKNIDGNEEFLDYNVGHIASYKRLPAKSKNMTLSHTAMNLKQLQRYENLINEKITLNDKVEDVKETEILPEYIEQRVSDNLSALNTNIEYANRDTLIKLHNAGKLIFTMRVSELDEKNNVFANNTLGESRHFGNPFTGTGVVNLIQMGPHEKTYADTDEEKENIQAAVNAYQEWLNGKDTFVDIYGKTHDLSSISNRRDWILSQIKELKEKAPIRLGYFKPGYKSHANVLNDMINGDLRLPQENITAVNTYKGKITELKPNQIFVFGSNPIGVNGNPTKGTGGAALVALQNEWVSQGEKMDNTFSKSGKAYGLTTVTTPGGKLTLTPAEIISNISQLYQTAKDNPDKEFLIAYAGSASNINNNGYTNKQMAQMFSSLEIPSNITFSDSMSKYLLGAPLLNYISTFFKGEVKTTPQRPTPQFNTLPSRSLVPNMVYAGVGSRETPEDIAKDITEIAKILRAEGFVLRSGKAQGADIAFEKGAGSDKEIFPGNKTAGQKEQIIAREIHPNPDAIDAKEKAEYMWNLMARNTNQIFGKDLDIPVDFVLAWTPDGLTNYKDRSIKSGGTGQAIEMASRKGIPVINLANPGWRQELSNLVKKLKEGSAFEVTPEQKLEYEIQDLSRKVAELEEVNNHLQESTVEMIVANNLPKILPESAKDETGANTGNTHDISTSLLSKNGLTVKDAAHDIWEDYFFDTPTDTQTVRNIIIDILSSGSIKNYKSQIDNSSEIEELKKTLKQKQFELNDLKSEKKVKKVIEKKEPKVEKQKVSDKKVNQSQLDLFSNFEESKSASSNTTSTNEFENEDDMFINQKDFGSFNVLDLIKKDPEIPETGPCDDVPF